MTHEGARDPLIGSLFNNYRIDALLAQGGMGAVYLLRDATLPNIRKVLKVILPEFANNASIRERFLREAEAVSMLRHPNVVGIDAIGSLPDGRLCMVIPFLEGKPLDQFLAEHGGRLAPHRVMHIVSHIARGLDYVHRQGIIHRDLKPGNVFVEPTEDDRYSCKVLDFGIAKQLNARAKRSSPTLSAPTGTPCYMSVEQYVSPGDVTPAADVFALAVMVWQMVAGCLPWGQHDPALMYQKQLQEPPERPVGSWLSPEWETLLREALSPDPRLRPQSVRQFVQALASRLPAIEPLFPSGVEILNRVARNLLTNSAHDDETVRNPSDRPPVPAWPVHETPFLDGRAPQNAAPAEAAPASPISSSPVTVNLRPASAGAAPAPAAPSAKIIPSPPTTLGSSAGTIEPSARAPRRRRRALLGLAAAGSVGVATLALVTTRGGNNVTPAAETVRQPSDSTPSPPIPSGSTERTSAHGAAAKPGAAGIPATAAPAGMTPVSAPSTSFAGSALSRTTSAAPRPTANHAAASAQPAAPRAATSSSSEPVPSTRANPKTPPTKAPPDQAPAAPSRVGSEKHHFDPNEIGGDEEK